MAGKRTRRRRGHPHGKAFGFNGLRPASSSHKTKSSDSGTSGTQTSGTSSTSSTSSDS